MRDVKHRILNLSVQKRVVRKVFMIPFLLSLDQDEGGIIVFGVDEERGYVETGVYDA